MNAVDEIKNRNLIHWFRKDQRVSDHEILSRLAQFDSVTAFYIHEEKYDAQHPLGFDWVSKKRKTFLKESLLELAAKLDLLGIGFHIFKNINELEASRILQEKTLTYQRCCGTEERKQENNVLEIHADEVYTFNHFTLVDQENLPFELHQMPKTFTPFKNKVGKYGSYSQTIALPKLPKNSISFELKGGENPALNRLKYYLNDSNLIATYKETRNGMVGSDYSSRLSPWLALGNVSARTVFDYIVQYENEVISNESTYWLIFELLWRDFFQLQLQIHRDRFFKKGGIQQKEIKSSQNEQIFWQWANGETGDDLVDANMRELNATGWMSNRGRQNVASYLIHDLGIDWRWGAAYLESQLIDYDPAGNYGNWMYIAGIGHDPRPFRKFNTQGQAERYDADRSYRDLWLK
ncbi:DASH family cryptochrome [Bacteroidia bacterium]|nr:DASH family cryptochrome [Bacteroidia bacterium]